MPRFPISYVSFAFGLALALPDTFHRPETLPATCLMLVLSFILAILHRRAVRRMFTDAEGVPSESYQEAWAKFVEAVGTLTDNLSEASALRAVQVTAHVLPTLHRNPSDQEFLPSLQSDPVEFLAIYLCPEVKEGDLKDLIIEHVGFFLIPALPMLPGLSARLDINFLWALSAAGVVAGAISAWTLHTARKAQTRTRQALEVLQSLRSNEGHTP